MTKKKWNMKYKKNKKNWNFIYMKSDRLLPPWPTMGEVMTEFKYHRKKYYVGGRHIHVPQKFMLVKYRLKKLTTISNLDTILEVLGVPTIYVMKYFSIKLGALIYTKKGTIIIHGFHERKKLHQLLKDFKREFVICPKCKVDGIDLIANEDVDKLQQICRECSYKRHLDGTNKLVRFILRHKKMKNTTPKPKERNLPKPKERNLPKPKEKNLPKPKERNLPKPKEKNLPKPKERNLPKPKERNLPKPKEKNLPKPKERNLPKPKERNLPKPKERNLAKISNPDEKMAVVLKLIDLAMYPAKLEKTISIEHTTLLKAGWSKLKCLNRKRYAKYKFMTKSEGINFSNENHKFVAKRKAKKISVTHKKPLGFSATKKKFMLKFLQKQKMLFEEREQINGSFARNLNLGKNKSTYILPNIKGKLFPKIRIENIPEYYANESIIDCIKDKNPWIENLVQNVDHFKMVANLKTKVKGTRHIVIKCSPKVRKNIKVRGDKLNVLGNCVMIYDTYHVIRCVKCQEFGHRTLDCTQKLICPKCGKEHQMKDCTAKKATCVYCHGRHITGSKSCQRYKEEEKKIKEATDHGEYEEERIGEYEEERIGVTDYAQEKPSIISKARRVDIEDLLKINTKYSKRTKKNK
ncbi:uncharacterized protein [Palaemon carinicauda]|uniref:uncharacterized protein n=1 Tax=Palaemon carinicauda TaxID=392227 RepID=UPI0035B67A97